MNDNSLIIAENISYKINENKLFHNISFNLKQKEALHICGPNGSGKSTLIRIILGLTIPTKGNINLFSKKNISYLGHKNAIKSYLTLEDNLLLMGLVKNPSLKKYLEILELKEFLDVIVGNLSFGQQKKVALLRIFLNNSDLIILDEPFVGLDTNSKNLVNEFLIKELDKDKGLIFTSHIKSQINTKIVNLKK